MTRTTNKHSIQLAVRIDDTNPLHHLWNNNGTWWCHFTLHNDSFQKQRVRMSLRTNDPAKAVRKRDLLFARLSPIKNIAT